MRGLSLRGLSFRGLVVGLLFGAIALTACLMPAQSDTYWHLRAGTDFWRTHHVVLSETYSHTAKGAFWPNHEWLWQAASSALHGAGGFPLLQLAGAATVTLAFALAWRLMVGPVGTRFLLMALAMPLSASVWALRPQIVSLALLATLLTLLARERYRWLPPLFALWANVHGAVALGGVVLGAAALAAMGVAWRRRDDARALRRALTLAVVLPLCALATLLTPLGTRLWTFVLESPERSRGIHIDEWEPAWPTAPLEIGFWILALAFLVLLVRRRRALVAWPALALAAATLAIFPLAVAAGRNIAPFLLAVIPAASHLLGPDFALRRPAPAPGSDHPRLNLAFLVVFALAGVAVVGASWAKPSPRLGWRPVSEGALAAVRGCPGNLYNRYNEGGYLIWLTPARPVFLDSRQDPYPPELVRDALAIEDAGDYAEMFARHRVRCAFLPFSSPTRPRLRDAGWRTRFADDDWTVMSAPGLR